MKTDKKNRFISMFDLESGFYMRTGVIDNDGIDTGVDPFMATMPELIDIGIMKSCSNKINGICKVDCYQGGSSHLGQPNMSLDDYKKVVNQVKGKTLQFALGGRGDPNKHENFKEILEYTKQNNIIPNYTTSGYNLTDEEIQITKDNCGAVAVSQYFCEATDNAINRFIKAGCKTNMHFVLSTETIDYAINMLKNKSQYEGLNAVVFLIYKPIGLGQKGKVLSVEDVRVSEFFNLVDNGKHDFKIGFDSCSCGGIVNFTKNINLDSIDYCEAARFSCYLDADMNLMPCSFGNQNPKYFVNLNEYTFKEAWNSQVFEDFRNSIKNSCVGCAKKHVCTPCPIIRGITLCPTIQKEKPAI